MQAGVSHSTAPHSDTTAPTDVHGACVVRTAQDAQAWVLAWQELSDRCDCPNAFYMPWFLIPALAHLTNEGDLQVLMVTDPADETRLVGVFPFVIKTRFKGLPLRFVTTWQHNQVFLGAPLIDRQHVTFAWAKAADWAKKQGALFLDLPLLPAELSQATGVEVNCFKRSILVPDPKGSDAYLLQAGSAKARKRWRRQSRRLSEMGKLELRKLEKDDPLGNWSADFLRLEQKGWKGQAHSAIANDPREAAFFADMARAAHAQNALHMMGFYLDGQPVAMQCNFKSGSMGFAFKVAFDEAYAPQSPGVLLELAAIADFHNAAMSCDSCAKEGHVLMGRLWQDDRQIVRKISAVGGVRSSLICSAFAALLGLRRLVKRLQGAKP